ncbi:MAG TPA: Flp pilus assembly protein CpaB [Caulobacteraceae bacterium]|jgi:pilus assembly protein CpaB|nr:Flp pilus assembly protein CpaB [Caulobacteraceae bacterium]
MKPIRIIVLAVAAVAAIGLALIVRNVMSGKPTSQASAAIPVAKAKPMARVLVAKHDLKIGQRLTAEDLDWQEWPVEAVNATFVTDGSVALPKPKEDPKDAKDTKDSKPTDAQAKAGAAVNAKLGTLAGAAGGKNPVAEMTHTVAMMGDGGPKSLFIGAVVRQPFTKGEPMIASKVVRSGDSGYMAVVLPAGMRAMAVGVKVETAAGGFILPGDRVDVIMSRSVQGEGASHGNQYVSRTVLQNIKVLAIDQVTQPDKNENTVVGATATLELTPTDAEVLAQSKNEGELYLTLRSYADIDGPSGHLSTGGSRNSSMASARPGVRVFRNGSVTTEAGVAQ